MPAGFLGRGFYWYIRCRFLHPANVRQTSPKKPEFNGFPSTLSREFLFKYGAKQAIPPKFFRINK
jgi:hypothetical protein